MTIHSYSHTVSYPIDSPVQSPPFQVIATPGDYARLDFLDEKGVLRSVFVLTSTLIWDGQSWTLPANLKTLAVLLPPVTVDSYQITERFLYYSIQKVEIVPEGYGVNLPMINPSSYVPPTPSPAYAIGCICTLFSNCGLRFLAVAALVP